MCLDAKKPRPGQEVRTAYTVYSFMCSGWIRVIMQDTLFFGNKNDANATRNNLAELEQPSLSPYYDKYSQSEKYNLVLQAGL
jgi:hypothetical protein